MCHCMEQVVNMQTALVGSDVHHPRTVVDGDLSNVERVIDNVRHLQLARLVLAWMQ